MNIILEGSDCSGKSTVANTVGMLLERTPIHGSSFSQAKKPNSELFDGFYNYTYLDNAIFDRNFISNLVYADLYKGYSILNKHQVRLLEERLKGRTKIFYLYADIDTIRDRMDSRGDKEVDINMIEKICNKYEEVLSEIRLPVIKINTSNKNPLEVAQKILNECGYAAYS